MDKKATFAILLTILTAFFAFGAYSAYLELKPKEVWFKKNITVATYVLGYDHYSIVSKENPLWSVGTKLFNRDVYFLRTNPELNVTFKFSLPSENFEVEYETKLIIASSASDKTFWKLEKVLASGRELSNSKNFSYSFTLNIPEIKREIENVERSLEFRGGSEIVKILTSVEASGDIKGERRVVKDSVEMTLKITESYYTVSSSTKKGKIERTVETKRKVPPSQREYVFAILKIAIPAFGIVAVAISYRIVSLPEEERIRKKFEKWISCGKLPNANFVKVEINSLEDLVDAAIDMNERVIFDETKNVYFFIHDEIMYTFTPKTSKKARQGEGRES